MLVSANSTLMELFPSPSDLAVRAPAGRVVQPRKELPLGFLVRLIFTTSLRISPVRMLLIDCPLSAA
jgi:hypothetical protein